MNSLEFREKMIKSVRAFDAWVWQDMFAHPEDYAGEPSFKDWFDTLVSFMENEDDRF